MLANLNYVHILVATLVYFVLGALWYSVLFQKPWVRLNNIVMNEESRKGMPKVFAFTFLLNLIATVATACVLYFVQPVSIIAAIKVGALLGFGFVGSVTALNNMYLKRPFMLTIIDAGYNIVSIILVSIILTMWH
jgi:hypothetical protein